MSKHKNTQGKGIIEITKPLISPVIKVIVDDIVETTEVTEDSENTIAALVIKPEIEEPKVEGLTEWQKKVESDLNAMAERCFEKRYLQINSHKPEFVDLKKETK